MKKFIAVGYLFVFQIILYPQIQKLHEVAAYYGALGGINIELTDDSIILESERGILINEIIKGKKILDISDDGEFFLISNFEFKSGKSDYPVTVYVFNAAGEKQFTYTKTLAYDLPHPLYKITGNGHIFAFDPYKYKASIIDGSSEKVIEFVKEIEPNMERECFIETEGNSVYILTSLHPEKKDGEGSVLYKVNTDNGGFTAADVNIQVPTALKITESGILTSGVNLYHLNTNYRTYKFSEELNVINSAETAGEKIIESGNALFFKFGNSLYKTDTNLNLINSFSLEKGERIVDIAEAGDGLAVLSSNDVLYSFSNELAVESRLNLNISYKNTPRLEKQADKLLLHFDNFTIIYN